MLELTASQQTYIYTDEADMLNKLVFGQAAIEWRKNNPKLVKSGKNQRDHATLQQLVILANLENLNAHFIAKNKNQIDRIKLLIDSTQQQYKSFITQEKEQKKLENKEIKNNEK